MENESTSVACERALEVYDANVSSLEVAKTYLKAEIPNIFSASALQNSKAMGESLDNLSEKQIWRLLEAISYTYRMNSVFHETTDTSKRWLDIKLPIDAITLTGTKPHIDDIVLSPEVNRSPRNFGRFLIDYFDEHQSISDDPLLINEFRPKKDLKQLAYSKLIMRESGDSIEMVDGTHRLMAAVLLGAQSVRTLINIPNYHEPKTMIGDSSFLTLRELYEKTASWNKRRQVMNVAAMLAENSTDGRDAIYNYWIEHPRSQRIKMAGQKVLDIIKNQQNIRTIDIIEPIIPSIKKIRGWLSKLK